MGGIPHGIHPTFRPDVPLGRREFLAGLRAAAAAPLRLPLRVMGRAGVTAPNDRIGIEVAVLGDRGPAHIRALLLVDQLRIAAVCDVLRSKAEKFKALVAGRTAVGVGAG